MARKHDAYNLTCRRCHTDIEVPARPVDLTGTGTCPRCRAMLTIAWATAASHVARLRHMDGRAA